MVFKFNWKILIILLFSAAVYSQDNCRLLTYNLLNYPDIDSNVRNPYFRKIINYSNPDILVVQEMTSQTGMNGFLYNVMNAYGFVYSMGTFIDGPDTDNGIFYKHAKYRFISNTRIRTALRDINEFKIIHLSYPADTLRILSVHLKAGSGSVNENLRASEVDSLRKFTSTISADKFYIVCGDFNIYADYEPAYIKLKQVLPHGNGHIIDALSLPGLWNQFQYRMYHTQSTRTRGFGGGATSGLDDRFDMILFSPAIFNASRIAYNPGTMTAFGNDGNHYNDSINRRPNFAVPDSIADALHYASDHLPVYANITFGNVIGITGNHGEIPEYFELSQNYPNPFNPSTKINYFIPLLRGMTAESGRGVFTKLIVYDMLGSEVSTLVHTQLKPGSYEVDWNASDYPSGVYFYTLTAGDYRQTRKMILMK